MLIQKATGLCIHELVNILRNYLFYHDPILPNAAAAMAWWSMEGCESAVGRSGRV